MYILSFILGFVIYLTIISLNGGIIKKIYNNSFIEILWTIVPTIIILIIDIPSINLLYHTFKPINPTLTIGITGNQWYWNYNYKDFQESFNSYLIPSSFRLSEVDNPLVIPVNTSIRILWYF